MAGDPFQHHYLLTPENGPLLANLERLSLRTALRFVKNLATGIAFLGGVFGLLLLLLTGAAVGFMVLEDLSPLNAYYFVLTTALTIGYGDITPHTDLGKLLAPLVGLTGMLMTGVFIAVAVRALEFTVRQEIAHLRAIGQSNASDTK
jgi:voltage-gated potassium channel